MNARAHSWTFLSHHAHVLVTIARSPNLRLRDIASRVGLTERGVQKIVAELEQGGVIVKIRQGRRNRYEINPDVQLSHPIEASSTVGELLSVAAAEDEPAH